MQELSAKLTKADGKSQNQDGDQGKEQAGAV